jgi:hypothetical protein
MDAYAAKLGSEYGDGSTFAVGMWMFVFDCLFLYFFSNSFSFEEETCRPCCFGFTFFSEGRDSLNGGYLGPKRLYFEEL